MTTGGVGHNLHKSVSTPSMVQHDSHVHSSQQSANKSTKRQRVPEPTHVFIQKLIAEHGWSNQRSGTDSETEGEDGGLISRSRENGLSVGQPVDLTSRYVGGHGGHTAVGEVPSPQLTLAEFLQKDLFSPSLSAEEEGQEGWEGACEGRKRSQPPGVSGDWTPCSPAQLQYVILEEVSSTSSSLRFQSILSCQK